MAQPIFTTVLVLLCFLHVLSAQYTLYGIDASSVAIEINTSNTNLSLVPLTTSSIPYILWQKSASFSSATSSFYFVGYNISSLTFYLVGVNTKDGSLSLQLPLPFNSSSGVLNSVFWDYSSSTQEIYLTGSCTSGYCMISVNPTSKSWREVATIPGQTPPLTLSVFDVQQNVEFLVMTADTKQQVLVGVNGDSGNIAYKMPIDLQYSLVTLDYDLESGFLYAVALKGNAKCLLQINTKGNDIEVIATLSEYTSVLSSISAMNQRDRVLFVFLSNSTESYPYTPYDLVAISIANGSITQSVPACLHATDCLVSIVSPV